jgi:hypothetical protein
MIKNKKIIAGTAAIVLVAVAADQIVGNLIDARTDRLNRIGAIKYAKDMVLAEAARGRYDDGDRDRIRSDFEFHRSAFFLQMS